MALRLCTGGRRRSPGLPEAVGAALPEPRAPGGNVPSGLQRRAGPIRPSLHQAVLPGHGTGVLLRTLSPILFLLVLFGRHDPSTRRQRGGTAAFRTGQSTPGGTPVDVLHGSHQYWEWPLGEGAGADHHGHYASSCGPRTTHAPINQHVLDARFAMLALSFVSSFSWMRVALLACLTVSPMLPPFSFFFYHSCCSSLPPHPIPNPAFTSCPAPCARATTWATAIP